MGFQNKMETITLLLLFYNNFTIKPKKNINRYFPHKTTDAFYFYCIFATLILWKPE